MVTEEMYTQLINALVIHQTSRYRASGAPKMAIEGKHQNTIDPMPNHWWSADLLLSLKGYIFI